MRFVFWIPGLLIFIMLLAFAAKNSEPVTVHFFLDFYWRVPLVLVMFTFFVGGVALGIAGILSTLFRQRREIGRLRRALGRDEAALAVVKARA
jgi:uncharacterized integral membrane protein